jgi:FKBP-type peptidyl-prolyl cis-trans isomerase FklB
MRPNRRELLVLCVLAGCGGQQAQQAQQAPETLKLESDTQKASYSIGMSIATDLKRQGLDLDSKALVQGLQDSLGGGKTLLSESDASAAMASLRQRMVQERQEKSRVEGEKNKKEGEAFLAQNKTKDGVVTLPSGLQYKVLKDGTGKTPSATSLVVTNYRGTLIDGTEFDSSYSRGQPATFPCNRVIKGWTEALQLMKEGAKWQLFIPSELAYGANAPPGGKIGPNAVLVFEIELLEVKEAQ